MDPPLRTRILSFLLTRSFLPLLIDKDQQISPASSAQRRSSFCAQVRKANTPQTRSRMRKIYPQLVPSSVQLLNPPISLSRIGPPIKSLRLLNSRINARHPKSSRLAEASGPFLALPFTHSGYRGVKPLLLNALNFGGPLLGSRHVFRGSPPTTSFRLNRHLFETLPATSATIDLLIC